MNAIVKKRNLGQFFTTNSEYILQGFEKFVKKREVIDPFAGNQDLMNWAKNNNCKKIIGFDYDKNYTDKKNVFLNDSLNRLKIINLSAPILLIYIKIKPIKILKKNFLGASILFLKIYIKFRFFLF